MNVAVAGPDITSALQKGALQTAAQVRARMLETANAASAEILQRGRADISGAGKFGSRWTQGLTADISEQKDTVTITVREAVPYWTVFQYGKVIHGRPLLYFKPDRPILVRGKETNPAVISKYSVTIPKKFHLIEICHDVGQRLGQLYRVTTSGR
jgi:hypothetical protein